MVPDAYPATFDVEYPDRELSRLTTFFRLFCAIPIVIVIGTLSHSGWAWADGRYRGGGLAAAILFIPPLLMIVFREKYPRWWFDWNLELSRFIARIAVYLGLMDDRYPSTDEQQSVKLDLPYPAKPGDVNRWFPLFKWILAIPHYIILALLSIAAFVAVIVAWFSILITGRYPPEIFDFLVGVFRWHVRVSAYAFLLVTDEYPPFRLGA
jgi:hypothetical protein